MSVASAGSQAVVASVSSDIPDPGSSQLVQSALRDALRGLEYGNIVITVHRGDVEQIDVIKKTRPFRSPPSRR